MINYVDTFYSLELEQTEEIYHNETIMRERNGMTDDDYDDDKYHLEVICFL